MNISMLTVISVALVRERTTPQSDRRLSAKLVPNFADRECHVVSVTDPYGRNLALVDRANNDCVQKYTLEYNVSLRH
jgi:hypothetical protein